MYMATVRLYSFSRSVEIISKNNSDWETESQSRVPERMHRNHSPPPIWQLKCSVQKMPCGPSKPLFYIIKVVNHLHTNTHIERERSGGEQERCFFSSSSPPSPTISHSLHFFVSLLTHYISLSTKPATIASTTKTEQPTKEWYSKKWQINCKLQTLTLIMNHDYKHSHFVLRI